MNRYTAAGVLADMRSGRRILVLSETQHLARLAFAEVAAGALDGERVRRAHGEERITAEDGRGWIVFRSSGRGAGLRGISVDVVAFDAHAPSRSVLESVMPNIMASPGGEIVRP